MSLFITSLNSGSNANCYYIGNKNDAVLIDAGLSCRETEKRMKRLGLNLNLVRAIFVTHEHTDHISGISGLSDKFQLPVYFSVPTSGAVNIPVKKHLIQHFYTHQPVAIGNLTVTGFPKFHDACDPHSFIVAHDGIRVGVFTDIGKVCKQVIQHFSQCHAAFLEANYCEKLLAEGNYPYHLKQRISGDKGHLSNSEALQLFKEHRSKDLTHLILSHLSKQNNRPELAEQLFNPEAKNTRIIVASRFYETPVFCIENKSSAYRSAEHAVLSSYTQLSLF